MDQGWMLFFLFLTLACCQNCNYNLAFTTDDWVERMYLTTSISVLEYNKTSLGPDNEYGHLKKLIPKYLNNQQFDTIAVSGKHLLWLKGCSFLVLTLCSGKPLWS